jgi:hypothetical protein
MFGTTPSTGPWAVADSGLPGSMSGGMVAVAPETGGGADVPAGTDLAPSTLLDATSAANPPTLPPDDRRCSAKSKRTHDRCKRYAIRGHHVCTMHGATRATKALARRTEQVQSASAIVASRDVEPMSDPIDSLLRVARRVELVAELIGDRLDEASDADAGERVALVGAYRGALADCAKVTAQVVALGLVERRLGPPEEDTARAWGQAVNAAILSDELALPYEQVETFRRLLRHNFAALVDG